MTSRSTVSLGLADALPRCLSSLRVYSHKRGQALKRTSIGIRRDARLIIGEQVRENYGLQIRLAFIGKPVRMSGQANELIGRFDKIFRSHGGVLAERHVVLAPNVEGRNANLASGKVEIIVNGAIPIERRGKGSWLGKAQRSLVNEVFRHARVECSAQPSGSAGEQGQFGRTVAESKEADVVETVVLCGIGFTGILKGDRVRRREHGQRLEPLSSAHATMPPQS